MDYATEYTISVVAFTFIACRNLSTAIICYYYSIHQVNKQLNNSTDGEDSNLGTIGTLAIEDFDTAMKSEIPVKYFKTFIEKNYNNLKLQAENKETLQLVKHCRTYFGK